MRKKLQKKNMTIDDLAVITAKGFEGLGGRMGKIENKMSGLDGRMGKLKNEMQGLRADVNNYLKLSDAKYLELKAREKVIVGWVQKIAQKTGIKIDIKQLEKI